MSECSFTGKIDTPGLTLTFERGLLIEVLTPESLPEPPAPPVITQNVTCSRKKLGQVFTTATDQSLNDFWDYFNAYARGFQIDAEVNENFFLAQVKAEVGTNLESVRENLNYSCQALKDTFSYYSKSTSEANADGRCNGHDANQPTIGNKAYANRIGNGSVSSGDGYLFRGGGFFQLTGRANYQAVVDQIYDDIGHKMSAEEYAGIITEVGAGLLGAMAFWELNGMYNCSNIDCCTEIINKYTNTYDTREQYYYEIAAIPAEGN